MIQLRGNFNTIKTEREVYNNFLGVDYATSVFNVSPQRAIDMRNFINVNGINHKRNGWNEIAQFNDKINGLWQFVDKSKEKHIIVHVGNKFYKLTNIGANSFETTYQEITLNEAVDSDVIINDKSYAVVAGERLYILCGDYLVYGTWDNGETWEIRRVEDNIDTYIPTTTIGISHINSKILNSRTGYDKVNLLNRRRKNTLIGENGELEIDIVKISNNPNAWGLSSFIETVNHKEYINLIGLNLQIINDEEVYNLKKHIPFSSGIQTFIYDKSISKDVFLTNGIVWDNGNDDLGTFFEYLALNYDYSDNLLYINLVYVYANGKEKTQVFLNASQETKYMLDTDNIDSDQPVIVKNYDATIPSNKYTFNYTEGSITFLEVYPPKIEGQANITVEFSKKIEGYADRINKCRFGALYGYNAGRDNLFVSGNPDYPNVDFNTSETYNVNPTFDKEIKNYGNFTYFPDTSYSVFGNEISEIMDYQIMGDGTQIVLKKAVGNEPTIFFRTSALIDALDEYGNPIKSPNGYTYKDIVYPFQVGTIGEGCITRFGNANLSGDILMLSQNGVFGIEYGTNIVVDDKYAKERSRLIYGRLRDFDLSNANAIVYDGRYFLAVGGTENLCFVADSRYKSQFKEDMSNTFNYEWWVWNNIPARVWFILNGKLSFGTYDGKICSFIENNFIDKSYSILELGALTGESNYEYGSIGEAKIFTKFTISITHDNDVGKLTENHNNRFTPVSLGSPLYEISDNGDGTFSYKETAPYGYIIKNIEEELGSFTLVNDLGDDIYVGTIDGSLPNITGYFMFCENVVSEWWTPVSDLGTTEFSKVIKQITVSPETIVGGEIEFGVETKQNMNTFLTEGATLFDWSRLDFTNWSFETNEFPKSFTKSKLRIKGNYFRFFFRSANDADGAINKFSFLYNIGKKNKGVN